MEEVERKLTILVIGDGLIGAGRMISSNYQLTNSLDPGYPWTVAIQVLQS